MSTREKLEAKNAAGREARARVRAANTKRRCPRSHKHGETSTCYQQHGCLCTRCREARSKYRLQGDWEARRMTGRDVWVPAHGAQRRLQALAYMGWSAAEIAIRMGSHYRPLLKIRGGQREQVRQSTHRRIAAVYKQIALVEATGHSALITKAYAREQGYASPVAWDDIDNPRERAKRGRTEGKEPSWAQTQQAL